MIPREFMAGDRVRPKGYLPATVVTGNINKRGELQVRFDHGSRLWFRPERLTLLWPLLDYSAVEKRAWLAYCYGMGDVKVGQMTGQYPNPIPGTITGRLK